MRNSINDRPHVAVLHHFLSLAHPYDVTRRHWRSTLHLENIMKLTSRESVGDTQNIPSQARRTPTTVVDRNGTLEAFPKGSHRLCKRNLPPTQW